MQYEFNILGQNFVVKSETEAAFAKLALEVVNQRLQEIQKAKPMLGPQQIAVLALLEIAGDMIKDRNLIDEYRQQLDQKCSSLLVELGKVKEGSSGRTKTA